jgi:hypothetical protein
MARKSPTVIELLILVAIAGIIVSIVAGALGDRSGGGTPSPQEPTASDREAEELTARLEKTLAPAAGRTWKDGLAAIVLVDVSGSMRDRIPGEPRRKLEAAQAAALDLVGAFARYAAAHADTPVLVGVQEFSAREGEPAARTVVPLGPPNPLTAGQAIRGMKASGGTPIGEAMVAARVMLDSSGLRRRHLLVVTDGENTDGPHPALVARVMERQKEDVRAPLYFVAFDVDTATFEGVKNAGGLLLSAKNGAELAATFDELLSDRILVEAP